MRNNNKVHIATGAGLIFLMLMGVVGWIMNIISIFSADVVLNGMFVARVIGAFIAPLGGVLGWF